MRVVQLQTQRQTYSKAANYVQSGEGDCPLLLTAPHGGTIVFENHPERVRVLPSTHMLVDYLTSELLDDTVKRMVAEGLKPYWVRGLIHRKYCDLNRPLEEACETPEMEAYYKEYHAAIADAIEAMLKRFTCVPVLIDLHGQSWLVLCCVRGTMDGESCRQHIDAHGEAFLTGKASLFGCLEQRGIDVDPPIDHPLCAYPKEIEGFRGGYTTQHYSGCLPYAPSTPISCIQLETGSLHRKDRTATADFATVLADSIVQFARTFLIP